MPRLAVMLLALATGCISHTSRIRDARQAYAANRLDRAQTLLAELAQRRPGELDCLALDRAMVSLAQGDAPQAERSLREVRDRFDHLEQQSLGESGLSLLSDDTAAAYSGTEYEKILIRVLLAVSNLLQDGSDAAAYCLQIQQQQGKAALQQVSTAASPADPPPQNRVALGAYLRGTLLEQSHRHYDDAERAYATVVRWEPNFSLARADLERVRTGVHSAPGHGAVYLLALVGRGPYRQEVVAEATSGALLMADQLLSAVGDHGLPPTVAPVKIPAVVVPANHIDSVAVRIDQGPGVLTQTITDVGRLAQAEDEATREQRIAAAIARRVVKKAAVYTAKDQLAGGHGLTGVADIALDAAGVLWEAGERADTRSWALLPEKIQVLRAELPAGEHRLSLTPTRGGRPLGPTHSTSIEVVDGRNTYVLASFPGEQLVGQILASRP